MKTTSWLPIFLLLFFAVLSSCKKDPNTPPDNQNGFPKHQLSPSNESIFGLVPWANGKMLALTGRGTLLVLSETTRDSFPALKDYDVFAADVSGDTLFALAELAGAERLLQLDLISGVIQVDEPAPTQSLDIGGILRGRAGSTYLLFHKDVGFLIGGYSDFYYRHPGGDWKSHRIYRDNVGIIILGGSITDFDEDANGRVWMAGSDQGLIKFEADTLQYFEIPTQLTTRVYSVACAPSGIQYVHVDNYPYTFKNGQFADATNGELTYFNSLKLYKDVFMKGAKAYFVYADEIYTINPATNERTHNLLKNMIGKEVPLTQDIQCAAVSSDGTVWMYVREEGLFYSDKI